MAYEFEPQVNGETVEEIIRIATNEAAEIKVRLVKGICKLFTETAPLRGNEQGGATCHILMNPTPNEYKVHTGACYKVDSLSALPSSQVITLPKATDLWLCRKECDNRANCKAFNHYQKICLIIT